MAIRKHLYTLPTGTQLPPVIGLPQGFPFLLISGDPQTVRLYVLVDGVFVAATGA